MDKVLSIKLPLLKLKKFEDTRPVNERVYSSGAFKLYLPFYWRFYSATVDILGVFIGKYLLKGRFVSTISTIFLWV